MSSLINKVKDALSSDHHDNTNTNTTHNTSSTHSSQPEGTHGPHSTRVGNAADPRVDSDRDHRAADPTHTGSHHTGTHPTGTHSTGTHAPGSGPAPSTAGPHKSDALNKADPRVDSDRDGSKTVGGNNTHNTHNTTGTGGAFFNGGNNAATHTGTHTGTHNTSSGAPEGTYGTHDSRLANAADPRIDSDRDGSRTVGGNTGTHTGAHTGTHTGTHGTTGAHHTGGHTSGAPEGTYGTHDSRLANAADPRIDSDRDGSRTVGGNTTGTHNQPGYSPHGHTGGVAGATGATGVNYAGTGHTGTHGTTGTHTGTHGTTGAYTGGHTSGAPEGTYGTHDSRLANAADPRIDSDRDGSHTVGGNNTHNTTTGTHGTGAHNTHGTQGTHGTHGTHGTQGTHGTHGAQHTGPAPNTAGPHKSDLLNKLDPRVDSNLDGSKTAGREKTFDQSHNTSSYAGKDPTDATQVPPSVMQKHIGDPVVAHEHHDHNHAKRHSISHQEQHRGL